MSLELHLSRVLELFDFDLGATDHINRFHETLHSFPHVRYWLPLLVLELGREGDLVLTEELHDPWLSRRVLRQVKLAH